MAIIKTLETAEKLAETAAWHIIETAAEAIEDHGFFSLVLAGGSTPKAAYRQLATVDMVSNINWEKVHVFWGDERCVPPTDEDSNYRMAFEILLRHSPIPVKQIHRMQGELKPKNAAQAYEQQLRDFFGDKPPRFDLVLLGLGEDGHTASVFPETMALNETTHWVIANHVPRLESWRLTLSVPLINQAANVTFLVSGASKAYIIRRVLAGRFTPEDLPAQMIRPDHGQLRWFLDRDADSFLEG